jgi:hypothetical protein
MRLFRGIAMASRNSHGFSSLRTFLSRAPAGRGIHYAGFERGGGGLHSSPPNGAGDLMIGSLAGAGEAFLLPPILISWRQHG